MRASTNDGGFCCFLYRLQIGLFLLLVAEPLSAAERGLRAVDHGLHRELRIVFYRSDQLLCKKVARSITLPMNQAITFLSDGGDTVRNLQLYLSPLAEHILDWFHVTMRLTVMKQMAVSLSAQEHLKTLAEDLDSVKWYLWHGNVYRALAVIESIRFDLDPEAKNNNESKLMGALEEFDQYIKNNSELIPNYSDRYHYGEVITTAFVESTVNELVSKRMVKKQQMRWTQKGAHLLLQVRVKTLNHKKG